MEDAKSVSLPILPKLQLTKSNDCSQNLPYKQLLGSLIYLMLGTRPDLCFSVTYELIHWKHLKNVVRYLIGTKELALMYLKENESGRPIECHCDSDFANDVEDRKSISGYVFKVFGNTVAWKTKKQPIVALSTCEAEYIALATCATECVFISRLLAEILSKEIPPVLIYEDNQSCIQMAKTLETKWSKRHVRFHYIKELIENKKVEIKYIATENQVGDFFTKGLPVAKFKKFRDELRLVQ